MLSDELVTKILIDQVFHILLSKYLMSSFHFLVAAYLFLFIYSLVFFLFSCRKSFIIHAIEHMSIKN